jgi:hypothetical protein
LEDLDQAELAESTWAAHRKENKITARGSSGGAASYEKVQWNFLDANFPNVFKSMKLFKSMNALRGTLKSRGLTQTFKSSMGNRVDFLNGAVDNAVILSVLHHMSVVICGRGTATADGPDKSLSSSIPSEMLDALLLICFEFAVHRRS